MSEMQSLSFRVADLPQKRPTEIALKADAALRSTLARELGVDQIKKLTFTGLLQAAGKTDWTLSGHLGATVVQPCVVTLDPVTTRIEEDVQRQFIAEWQIPEEAEAEMPEDDTSEPLGPVIDTMSVVTEALSLAIPAYPRADGAELGAMVHAEPGIEPLNEQTVKPFASLAELKKKMEGNG
ncbi:MAG: DUF177 domain-containing protein [Pseudomonadota bacterium]